MNASGSGGLGEICSTSMSTSMPVPLCRYIAPSPALRRWFSHDPTKWAEFQRRYRGELEKNPSVVEELKRQIERSDATLLYAAKDPDHNHAIVLRHFIGKD